jgi:hypothetical protein
MLVCAWYVRVVSLRMVNPRSLEVVRWPTSLQGKTFHRRNVIPPAHVIESVALSFVKTFLCLAQRTRH